MIKTYLFYGTALGVLIILILASFHYKGGNDAMVAQVESQVMAISYQKPVLVRKIHVSPGQVVDSGDLLIEVERPDLALDMDRKLNEKIRYERNIEESVVQHKSALKILLANYDRKIKRLIAEKKGLEYELRIMNERKKKLDGFTSLTYSPNDSLKLSSIKMINDQLDALSYELDIEKMLLLNTFQYDTSYYHAELTILEKEIAELGLESEKQIKFAERQGTVGNLFVELNELAPPYKTLMSMYDLNPTLIKAFIHERGVKNLNIGAKVKVESVHKKYAIEGEIVEIGSRITSYPDKINPMMQQKSYGQEIFINIPDKNNFLNGEKVYVYVNDDEK